MIPEQAINISPSAELADVLVRAQGAFCSGDYSGMLRLEPHLEARLRSRAGSESDQLEVRAVLAGCQLRALDIDAAGRVLEPYILKTDDGIRPNSPAIDRLRHRSDLAKPLGLLLLQLARFFYRSGVYSSSEKLAREAIGLLNDVPNADAFVHFSREESNILFARVSYRLGRREVAEELLRHAITQLTSLLGIEEHAGGAVTLLAHAHGLLAAFGWNEGRFDDARRSVYTALFLLRDGARNERMDELGLAYALYTAGRIEAGHGDTSLHMSLHLLKESEAIFKRFERGGLTHQRRHPFLSRVQVQLAQTYVKASRLSDARRELALLETVAPEARVEAERIRGDILLTRIWLFEAESADARAREACLHACEELFAMKASLPSRLSIEAELHLGIALIGVGRAPEGRAHVTSAIDLGESEKRTTIMIRAHFALAESFIGEDRPLAVKHFRTAQTLLSTHPSTYLLRLRDRLAPHLEAAFHFQVDTLLPWSDVEDLFMKKYFEFHLGGGLKREELAGRLGISRSTFFDHLKRLGLTRGERPDGGGPREDDRPDVPQE